MGCIRNQENKSIFSYIKRKHSVIKLNYFENIVGELIIKSVRQYQYRYEVDVEFKGSIWGRGSSGKISRFEQHQLVNLSKIKVYRIMRNKVLSDLKTKLSLFGVEIKRPGDISKIKWVG